MCLSDGILDNFCSPLYIFLLSANFQQCRYTGFTFIIETINLIVNLTNKKNGLKLRHQRFSVVVRKNFHIMRTLKYWKRLSGL